MNYEKYRQKALAKITQYGNDFEIVRTVEEIEIYKPETNEYENAEIRIKGKGLLCNYSDQDRSGTNIQTGDVKIMCVFDEKPEPEDTIVFGGKTYKIVQVSEVNPNGACVIYYEVQAR